ncbi:hypothetical protein Tco_1505512 [Tanacetum coccineum]
MVSKSLEHAVLAKESSQPKYTYEAASSLIEFELKKILINKMDESQSYLTAPEHRECYNGLIKSYDLNKSLFSTYDKSEEPEFEVADSDMPQDQEKNLGNDDEEPKGKVASKRPAFKLLKGTRSNYTELEYDFEECYKALLEKLDWNNPEGGDYPFDLTKPLPLVMNGNHQIVLVDYFFNNDLKYLQGRISTMTYTTSITKTKVAQYDLPGIEDMTFYGYPRGLESNHDVYSTKRILAVTRVEVMKKHGYGYLKEIVVRRADNDLYIFNEGDFPRLCLSDIEDMLLLIVQNRLTNLSSDDIFDFAIALRMFTRSLVIQKSVEDLQLGVKSNQKKINVTGMYRIFTQGKKTKPNQTKPRAELKRARKTEAKGAKGLKTELKRTFPDLLDIVCAFKKVKTKSSQPRDMALKRALKTEPENLNC